MSYSLTAKLIHDTTATNTTTEWGSSRIYDSYSLLNGYVLIDTQKKVGWNCYETIVSFNYGHNAIRNETFDVWLNKYVCELSNRDYTDYEKSYWTRQTSFKVAEVEAERASVSRRDEAHKIGSAIAQSYVLTILNKYIECIFNDVQTEVIQRQITELQNQLATIG